MNVVPLPNPTPDTAHMIAALESVLRAIQDGHVDGFLVVATKRDGSVMRSHGWEPERGHVFRLLGAVTHEARYLSQCIDKMHETTDHLNGPA